MNETRHAVAPTWFMIVSSISLVWNLFGLAVFAMAMTVFRNREALENAGLNDRQVDLTLSTPTWVNVAFGIAVIFGVMGCIALLTKRKLAVALLTISLLGVLAQNIYMYFLSDTVEVMGVGASPVVIAAAIALIPFATFLCQQGLVEMTTPRDQHATTWHPSQNGYLNWTNGETRSSPTIPAL